MQPKSLSLLERLRQSEDPEAWARFVELYTPLLFHWALDRGLPEVEAADLVQDIFTIVVQYLRDPTFDGGRGFRSWLRTLIVTRWLYTQEERGRQPRAATGADLPSPDGPDAFWEAEYQHRLLGRALELMQAELEPTNWRACWECVVVGKPVTQVAAELGLSEHAVHLARGYVFRRLREELNELLD
jgi:RNA polymerase sigma-70 factor (ECF subfamily)